MPKTAKRTVYRDRKTGRFASKATWKRSRARGSERYTRTSISPQRKRKGAVKAPARPARLPVEAEEEYQINVKYTRKGESKLEVQISATGPTGSTRDEVLQAIEETRRNLGTSPSDWKVRIKVWERGGKIKTSGDKANEEESWRAFNFFYRDANAVISPVGNRRRNRNKK